MISLKLWAKPSPASDYIKFKRIIFIALARRCFFIDRHCEAACNANVAISLDPHVGTGFLLRMTSLLPLQGGLWANAAISFLNLDPHAAALLRMTFPFVIARWGTAPTWQSHPLLFPCKTPAPLTHKKAPELSLRLLIFSLKACRRVTSGFYSQHPHQLSGPLHESQSASLRPSQSVQSVALSS